MASGQKKRCFITLDLDNNAVSCLQDVQARLWKAGLFEGKFTERENIHLTLKFLGEIDADQIRQIRARLSGIRKDGFRGPIRKAGAFSRKDIRIIWMAFDTDEVRDLQNEIDEALEDVFNKERRFMGHITIARVKRCDDKRRLLRLLDDMDVNIPVRADSFSLMSSELTHDGPRYSLIERYSLE